MKGFFFQRPLEYHLATEGEEWQQGSNIQGTLRVKNVENTSVTGALLQVGLAFGSFKKIKTKEEDAWKPLQCNVLEQDLALAAQEEKLYHWQLELPTDCPITEKGGSPFLLYGGNDLLTQGRLDLKVKLFPMLQSFLQTFETQFRFQKKYEKSKENFVEVKMVPPDSKEFPTLDHLLCFLQIQEGRMKIRYVFKMKALGKKEAQEKMKVTRKKREWEQEFSEAQYSQGGFPNRECFRKAIAEALNEAKPQVIF